VQQPLALFDDAEPVLDLMLLKPDADESRIASPQDVLLLVEVADTTLRHDRTTKAARYAAARVPDYWIYVVPTRAGDPPGLIVHRQPGPQGYAEIRSHGPGETVAPLALTDWRSIRPTPREHRPTASRAASFPVAPSVSSPIGSTGALLDAT
jgi:Uma2 family endonuclease